MGISEGTRYTRRQALQVGGGLTASLVAAGMPFLGGAASAAPRSSPAVRPTKAVDDDLPVEAIEAIVKVKGTFSNGVLNIEVDRDDLKDVRGPRNIPVKPSFEANGNLCFQSLGGGSAMMNSDLCFTGEELNPAIDKMIAHGIQLQAFHQHVYNFHHPHIWFLHFRGRGAPLELARGAAAILSVTSTPRPQAPPPHPHTTLDTDRLSRIIGAPASVGAAGVVSFELPQREPIMLGGVRINPYLNVYTPVTFEPLGGSMAAVVPDFGLLAHQIEPVMRLMRRQGWEIGCLYNQETDEFPQLFFSHQIKVGNAYQLASEVRKALELTSVSFTR